MRPIKFRAWYKNSGILTQPFGLGEDNFKETSPIDGECYNCLIEDADDLIEFTGLFDKNGKEIYEGDIVLTDEAGWVAEVFYNGGIFTLRADSGFSLFPSWSLCEVIGNIYENPELLNT